MYRKDNDPNLTPKYLETSDITEIGEMYSVYLRFDNIIDSVSDIGIIEWE